MSKTLVQGKLTDVNDPSLSYLEVELIRLTSEEELRNESYNQARTDLQDIWNKIVGLEKIIHAHASEIENLKIECVASRPEEQFWQLHKPSAEAAAVTIYNEQSQQLSLQSAGRLADIQILKEKIRIKEGYRLRLSVLQENIDKSRQQLHQLTETLKVQQKNAHSDAPIDYSHGGINASMNIRNLLVETTHNISVLEADFVRTSSEYDLLTAELHAALNSKDNQDLFSVTITNNEGENRVIQGATSSHPSTTDNALVYQSQPNAEAHRKVDADLLEILGHGAVTLSPDLIEAVKKGTFCTTAHLKETAHANSPHTSNYINKVFDFTLSEVLAGAAKLVRSNGEAPVSYLVRVERRLAALLSMEDELQTELTNKIDDLKVLKKQLHDVELKRLKVELSVSNMLKNRQQIEYNHAINSINSMSLRHSIHLANQQRHFAQPPVPDYYTVLNQVLHEQQRQLAGNGAVRPIYNPAAVPVSAAAVGREQIQLLNQLLELQQQQSQPNTPVKPTDAAVAAAHAAAGIRPNQGFGGYQDSPTFQYNEVYERPLNKVDLLTPAANQLRTGGPVLATPAPHAATKAGTAAAPAPTVAGTPFVWYGDVYEQPMDMLSPTFNPLDHVGGEPPTAVKATTKRVSIAAQHAHTLGYGAASAMSPYVAHGEIYDHQLGYTPMVNPGRPGPTSRSSSAGASPFSPPPHLQYGGLHSAGSNSSAAVSSAGGVLSPLVDSPVVPIVNLPRGFANAPAGAGAGTGGGVSGEPVMHSNPMRNRNAAAAIPRAPPLVPALSAVEPPPLSSNAGMDENQRPFNRTDYISRGLAGSTTSPKRPGRRSIDRSNNNTSSSTSIEASARYEASILQQLTQHIQRLNSNNPTDSKTVLNYHEEMNRLVMLYLTSSATSIQVKVKVLSGLLSTDYNLDGMIRGMESGTMNQNAAAAAASAGGSSNVLVPPPASKSTSRSSFEEVRQRRAANDAAKNLRIDPNSSPSATATRNNGTSQSFLSSLSTNSPDRLNNNNRSGSRSRSSSPSKQLLFPSMSVDVDDNLSAFPKDNQTSAAAGKSRSPSISPSKTSVVTPPGMVSADAQGVPVLTPLMPPSPVVTNRTSRVLLCSVTSGPTPKKVSKPIQTDASNAVAAAAAISAATATTETGSVTADAAPLAIDPSLSLVVSPPPKTEISSITAPTVAASSSMAPSVIPSATPLPCQCKYCTQTPYEYHTLYDRNGRYIGPKNCVRKQQQQQNKKDSAAPAPHNRDIYLHTYMNPHEAEQLFLRRTIDSLKASRGSDASSVLSSGSTALTTSVRSDHKVKHVVETEYVIEQVGSPRAAASATVGAGAGFESPEGKPAHQKNRRSPSLTSGVSHVKKRPAVDRNVSQESQAAAGDIATTGGDSEGGILFRTPSPTHRAIRVSGTGGKTVSTSPLSSNQLDIEHRRYVHKADTLEESGDDGGNAATATTTGDESYLDVVTCGPVSSVKSVSSATKKRLASKASKLPVAHTYNSLTQGTSTTKHTILTNGDEDAVNGVVESQETFTTGKSYGGCAICARLRVTKIRRETTTGGSGGAGRKRTVKISEGAGKFPALEGAVEDSEEEVEMECTHKQDTFNRSWSVTGRLLELADISDNVLEEGGDIMRTTPHSPGSNKSSAGGEADDRTEFSGKAPGSVSSKASFRIATDLMDAQPLRVEKITDVLGKIKLIAADLHDTTTPRPGSSGGLKHNFDDAEEDNSSPTAAGAGSNLQMRNNNSEYLIHSLEMQQKEIEELNATQRALQLMLQNKETLTQIKDQQKTLLSQLIQTHQDGSTASATDGSSPSHNAGGSGHLRSTATMTSDAPSKKKVRRSSSAYVAAVNPSFYCTASLSSINNSRILPESLIKSGAWVRARSRSGSGDSSSTSSSTVAVTVNNVSQLLPERTTTDNFPHDQSTYTLESIAASVHSSGGSRASNNRLYHTQSGSSNRNIHYDPNFLGSSSDLLVTPNRLSANLRSSSSGRGGINRSNSDMNAENQARAANIVRSTSHRKHTAYINYSYGSSSSQHPHHSSGSSYLNSSMYAEMLAFLQARLVYSEQKYHSVGAVEMIHQDTGIAYSTTDGCSKGFVEITMISARNLPPMKTIHKKADAYANINLITVHNNDPLVDHTALPAKTILTLVNTHLVNNHVSIVHNKPAVTLSPPSSPSARFRFYDQFHGNNPTASAAAAAAGLTSDFLTGAPRNVDTNFTYDVKSESFQKTSVKAETLFPEWREYFKFHDVHSLQNQSLLISVMDSTKAGFVANSKDTLIGQCVIPLHSSLLRDQLTHTMWLDLVPPPSNMSNSTGVRRAQVVRLPEQCSIKVEVRLFFSHTQYWRDQCTEMQKLIAKLHEIYEHTSDQHRQHSYAQDKTVLDKITKLMAKHNHNTSSGGLSGVDVSGSHDFDHFWNHPEPHHQQQQPQRHHAVPVMRRIVGLREKVRDETPQQKSATAANSGGGAGGGAAASKTIKRGRSLIPRPEEENVGGGVVGGGNGGQGGGMGDSFYRTQHPAYHRPRQTATPNYTGQAFFPGGGYASNVSAAAAASAAPESGNHDDIEREVPRPQINLDSAPTATAAADSQSSQQQHQQYHHQDSSVDYSNSNSRIDLSIFRQSGGRRIVANNTTAKSKNHKSPHHQPLGFNSSDAREFEL